MTANVWAPFRPRKLALFLIAQLMVACLIQTTAWYVAQWWGIGGTAVWVIGLLAGIGFTTPVMATVLTAFECERCAEEDDE